MSQLKRSRRKQSEEERGGEREAERKGTGMCGEIRRRDRCITPYLCSRAVTLSVELLYNQMNHLPLPSNPPPHPLT